MNQQSSNTPLKTQEVEIENPSAKAHPLVFKQSLPVDKNNKEKVSGALQTATPELSAPGGISLIEILLVLSIMMALATAAFVIYPQVRNAKHTNDMVAHISAWQNKPVPEDEEFVYRTLANEKDEVNEIQVIAKKPQSYAGDLLESSFERVAPMLEGQSKKETTNILKKTGLVPNDKCIIDASLQATSIKWEYEKGCSTVPSSLR